MLVLVRFLIFSWTSHYRHIVHLLVAQRYCWAVGYAGCQL